MIKYKTNLDRSIEKFNVIKESKCRITYEQKHLWRGEIRQCTENKISNFFSWHESFDEAKQHLIDLKQNKIDRLTSQLNEIKSLKEE